MKIVNEWPPNIQEIAKKFGHIEGFNPVFTYGDTLYNPTGGAISDDLMVHEQIHEKQQAAYGIGDWWARYLTDDAFRLTQEVEAYQAQIKSMSAMPRNWRRKFIDTLAKNLSSLLYGKIINKKTAKELLNG